jgi:glutathione S-transferase
MERYRLQEWLNFTTSELHKRYGTLFNKAAQPEWKAAVRQQLAAQLEHPARHLASRPFLLGDRFTVADAYLFVVLSWSRWVEVDLSGFPALGAYSARIAARPAVQAALKAEGLS